MKGLFIGTTTIDLIYPIEQFPAEDSKLNVAEHLVTLGGPATNAAITFTALGGEATLISPVGVNPWTSYIKQQLANQGVIHYDLASGPEFTPTVSSILVNISSGLRTVITSPASATNQLLAVPEVVIEDYEVCCLDGFHAEVVIEIIKNRAISIPVVFDGGSYKYKTTELLKLVDFPIFSERFMPPNNATILEYMRQLNLDTFAITKGLNPIEYVDAGRQAESPVRQVQAIDTLAAGDIFHGAFSYFIILLKGDFKAALQKSSEIASYSCQFLGPRAWQKNFKKN